MKNGKRINTQSRHTVNVKIVNLIYSGHARSYTSSNSINKYRVKIIPAF